MLVVQVLTARRSRHGMMRLMSSNTKLESSNALSLQLPNHDLEAIAPARAPCTAAQRMHVGCSLQRYTAAIYLELTS